MSRTQQRADAAPGVFEAAAAGLVARSEAARRVLVRAGRRVRIRALAGALASVLLLAGCVPAPAADPMTDQLRAGIQQKLADQAWELYAKAYPEAHRPEIAAGPIEPEFLRTENLGDCYTAHGIEVTPGTGLNEYGPGDGMSQIDFAVAQYECAVQVPHLDQVVRQLGEYQLRALYDYYVTKLRPCLQFAGQPTTDPPTRTNFVLEVYATLWSPYDAIAATPPELSDIRELERRCPPVPEWLHL